MSWWMIYLLGWALVSIASTRDAESRWDAVVMGALWPVYVATAAFVVGTVVIGLLAGLVWRSIYWLRTLLSRLSRPGGRR